MRVSRNEPYFFSCRYSSKSSCYPSNVVFAYSCYVLRLFHLRQPRSRSGASLFSLFDLSLRTADAFPVVASLPPKIACEQQTHFRSSEGEKRRPGMRLLFAGYFDLFLLWNLLPFFRQHSWTIGPLSLRDVSDRDVSVIPVTPSLVYDWRQ